MDDLLYDACVRYFTALSHFGYRSYKDVNKLLFYIFVDELVNNPSIVISEDDYKTIESALYCIYGTSCLIPYPNYCEKSMKLHLGDIAELSQRIAEAESAIEELQNQDLDNRLNQAESTLDSLGDDVTGLQGLDYVVEGGNQQ